MPLRYTYCVSKLIRKDVGTRFICYLRHQHLCKSYNPTFIARQGRLRILTRCRTLLAVNSHHYVPNNAYFADIVENDYESISQTSKNIPSDVLDKIKYNCILSEDTVTVSWNKRKKIEALARKEERKRREHEPDIPFSLKYMDDNVINEKPKNVAQEKDNIILPFHQAANTTLQFAFKKDDSYKFYSDRSIDTHAEFHEGVIKTKDWLKDHAYYCDRKEPENVTPWRLNYGTPDRSIPITTVSCGGCGALLQCQDSGIPGYLPSELIKNCTNAELRAIKCQRCHFLEQYNMALNLSVSPDEYPRLMAHLKDEFALAILMVDVTDFPCSLWPGILDIVGRKRPVIVVGNKTDLLPRDCSQFLSYATSWLTQAVENSELGKANVKHVALVSAQTGFGVEGLITKVHTIWGYKGDVYLLGCTNVGKSTLFNALLQSDLCKVKAVDIMQRATTSPWPGTTLNLLKFPILRPEGWRLFQRVHRLKSLQHQQYEELELLRRQMKKSKNPRQATLIGHIGRTFVDISQASSGADPFSVRPSSSGHVNLPGFDPERKDFAAGNWCYDTPGAIHPDQIIDILTAQELVHVLPREMILPRSFSLYPGDTVLIAGIGRLDFESGPQIVRFTVFAASTLPLTVCRTTDVDLVYRTLAASNLLVVPNSQPVRLSQWSGLSAYPHSFEVTGIDSRESTADVVLSSAGWIAVTPELGETCVVKAWTPFARGIHVRQPALMRFSVNLRGKKVRKSPAYLVGRAVRV